MVLRALISKIHLPLPMSASKSEQLLSAITSSFRKQLVLEPPVDNPPSHRHSSFKGSSDRESRSSCGPSKYERRNKQVSSFAAVDHHLNAVLASPLFSLKPRATSSISSRAVGSTKHGDAVSQVINDPLAWFEEQVALGTATQETAKRCLLLLSEARRNLPLRERIMSLKDSRAGSSILRWLWASGLDTLEGIASDLTFSRLLIYHLVAEGRSYAVWERIQIHSSHPGLPELTLRGSLLATLVEAEVIWGSGTNAAVEHFLRALRHILGVVHIDFDVASSSSKGHEGGMKPFVRSAQVFLKRSSVYLFTTFQKRSVHISEDLLQQFLQTLPYWDSSVALSFFRRVARHGNPSLRSHLGRSLNRRAVYALQFGLDTAHTLLKQKRYADAAWLLEFLQRSFPDNLDLRNDAWRAAYLHQFLDSPEKFHQEATKAIEGLRKWFSTNPLAPWSPPEHVPPCTVHLGSRLVPHMTL